MAVYQISFLRIGHSFKTPAELRSLMAAQIAAGLLPKMPDRCDANINATADTAAKLAKAIETAVAKTLKP